MSSNTKPYENLDPNLILSAIESAGFFCSGSLFALNSYENRVYQIGIEDAPPLITKFYRPSRWSDDAILEEHQFAKELVQLEIPIVAPLEKNGQSLFYFDNYRFAVFPRVGGHGLDLDNYEHLTWMGRFVGRLHAVGACNSFLHRPLLNVQTHGLAPYQFLLQQEFIPDALRSNYQSLLETLIQQLTTIFAAVGSFQNIRIHGDCQRGNVLWKDTGPHIVDLDDCLMGPAIQDLWMFLSGDPHQMEMELDALLEGYQQFHDFNPREVYLIEPLRTLRMIQYSAWLANRWEDPAFPKGFPWFNTFAYWEEQIKNLHEQSLKLEQTLAILR